MGCLSLQPRRRQGDDDDHTLDDDRCRHALFRETPLPSEAIPDRLRNEEGARREVERVPGGAQVVGSKEIEGSRGANLKDALDFVPGVLIRPRFGAADESQLSIRGSGLRNNFHLRGVNVLIDGFTYGNADGFSDFEALELLSTKYIEVYKGADALRFGGLKCLWWGGRRLRCLPWEATRSS
jgi:iron complex outermembrane receptor protein